MQHEVGVWLGCIECVHPERLGRAESYKVLWRDEKMGKSGASLFSRNLRMEL